MCQLATSRLISALMCANSSIMTASLLTIRNKKNPPNISTNPRTPNENEGQIIANANKMDIINALIVNQSPMTDNMHAPKSGVQRITSPLKRATQLFAASIASLTLAHADTTPATTASNTTATQTSQKIVKVDALADYKLKVDKMTEKELRAESKRLEAIIQPLVDSDAEESKLRPPLLKFEIVANRLDPIIEANTTKNKTATAENKEASKEMKHATGILKDIKKQLETPEKVDPEILLAKLQEALAIHKKYNPELYVTQK